MFAPVFGGIAPNPPYNTRFDLTGEGMINGSDFLKFAPFFYRTCTSQAAFANVASVSWVQPSPQEIAQAFAVADYRCGIEDAREARLISVY